MQKMNRPLIASPPWTAQEEQRVLAGAAGGEHPAAIGKALGRTEQAVRHRIKKLGIPSKPDASRKSPSQRLKAARDAVSAGWIGLKVEK